ncbi:hypothetical protein GCM10007387_06100 [Pseudoduganella albidiflava]|uniref:Uncharacterized protein n=1 Tax=Pseudoduganella albidiflava TaxID=321983 RepID=A0AA88C0Z2_9BURK|nr:hypothetical protein GCM10007387_06100 [Pseudoduganella albidiflava]
MPTSGAGKASGAACGSSLRVIYFWKDAEGQFWLFTVYDKDEAHDLTPDQCKMLKQRLESEIKARRARQ